MSVPPLIQDTVEALAIIGGTIKRHKRHFLQMQGEIEKTLNAFERLEKFITERERELKKLIEETIK
jgi:chromosome segregation ATPase